MTDALALFCQQLESPEHQFAQTLTFIERYYQYQPSTFSNNGLLSMAGSNEGSCKIFALALLEGLSKQQTLLAFAEHYQHVLATPEATDHANIRALLKGELSQIQFEQSALKRLG